MRSDQRDDLRERFGHRCGYCGISETDAGALLTIDHYQPRAHGGSDSPENLIYCCHACNEFKADHWQPDSQRRILHPERDDLSQHVREDEDATLVGLTETGEFHVTRLRLNRPELIQNRLRRRRVASLRDLQAEMLSRLRRLEGEVRDLIDLVSRLDP